MRKTLHTILRLFSPPVQAQLKAELDNPQILGFAARRAPDGRMFADLFDSTPALLAPVTENGSVLMGYWFKPIADFKLPTRTAQAVTWMQQNPGKGVRETARLFGLNASAISRHLKRLEAGVCPCCGRPL